MEHFGPGSLISPNIGQGTVRSTKMTIRRNHPVGYSLLLRALRLTRTSRGHKAAGFPASKYEFNYPRQRNQRCSRQRTSCKHGPSPGPSVSSRRPARDSHTSRHGVRRYRAQRNRRREIGLRAKARPRCGNSYRRFPRRHFEKESRLTSSPPRGAQFFTSMSVTPTPPVAAEPTARDYNLAHNGKLMRITREEGRARDLADFFQFESAGTHPTGLFVTGIFADGRRSHMRAALVRDASSAEIAWRNSYRKR